MTSANAGGIVAMTLTQEDPVMPRSARRYSAKLKFQVVLEALKGEKTPGQIAKAYGIHANSVGILEALVPGTRAGYVRT